MNPFTITKKQLVILFIAFHVLFGAHLYRGSTYKARSHTKYFQIDPSAEPYRAEIELAYKDWAEATGITFIEQYKPFKTVVIHYTTDTLAHPLLRDSVGLYHPNSKKIQVLDGEDFYRVVLHEIGHSIGLEHTNHEYDIMYPITNEHGYITLISLKQLEIQMRRPNYIIFY